MPIRLDHAERRSALAQAVWRIVLREGVRGASVRGVAREAGLSMGSVRHFFSTQDELLCFAMREVIEQARRRIEAGAPARAAALTEGRPLDAALDLLEQALPLDDERLTEARVWAAFAGQSATEPAMAAIQLEADEGIRQLCENCLAVLAQFGQVDPSRDLELETDRLWALLDGLTMHVLDHPARTPPAHVRRLLTGHLVELGEPVPHSQATPSPSRSSPAR